MDNRDQMNRFAINPVNTDISRSLFNRNHSVKFSANCGDVIPFLIEECLPADSFSVDTSKVVRLQPLVAPIMDNLYLDTYYFFVPNRLIWEHWVNFMGETENLPWLNSVTYTIPQITIPTGGYNIGTIADYMGIAPLTGAGTTVSALPFRAYALVCDQWFRDENLMTPLAIPKDDTTVLGSNGSDQVTDIAKGGAPFIAAKFPDYFTSCLPEPQRGPSVTFDLAGTAPVFTDTVSIYDNSLTKNQANLKFGTTSNGQGYGTTNHNTYLKGAASSAPNELTYDTSSYTAGSGTSYSMAPVNLWADMSKISQFSINELRTAFQVQKFYERSARGGSRYIEFIKAFFNTDSPDARMQRAEYLGGNRMPISIAEVNQTSETNVTPQGNPTGISATGDVNSDFTYSCTEHGWIIGVCVLRYNHTYQQGIERFWKRKTMFDFYNPLMATLGEMPVMKTELYAGANATDVFGYQEAWADYRYRPSRVAGEMRSVASTSLDIWHLADNYNAAPTLSASWIREDKSMLDRCLAVTSAVSNQYWCDFYIQEHAVRPMPLYSIPGLIDHH